jgi:nucleoside-diphosphate-sugar epimerase
MTIRWITPQLGTCPAEGLDRSLAVTVVDVRDLADRPGNRPDVVEAKIDEGYRSLAAGHRTVVCCDQGISRSNAIAAGVLARYERIPVAVATRRVLGATGETQIKLELIDAVRAALGEVPGRRGGPESDRGTRLLLLGAGGFLGSALVPKLSRTFEVAAPARRDYDLTSDLSALGLYAAELGITHVLHFARPRPGWTNQALGTSLIMLANLLDLCRSLGATLVYPSSSEVFGGYSSVALLADERMPMNPRSIEGEMKYLSEQLIESYSRQWEVTYAIVRSGYIYGYGDAIHPLFLRRFFDKALAGEEIATHRYRNGAPSLDLLHVDDYVDAIARIVQTDLAGVIHVGSGAGVSTADLARSIASLCNSESRLSRLEMDEHAANVLMNIEKARQRLGWAPGINLATGLEGLLARRRPGPGGSS